MEQQFSLSWNNFHGNLTKGFAGLLGNGEFVDVTIAVEGHLLQAHKVILSICSPYFKKMFQMNPCQHPIVVLRDVTHKAMRDLLQFMYHGEVSVKREDLTSFIGTAEVLQIKGLTNKETEEDENEHVQEFSKHSLGTQNNIPDAESSVSETFESSPSEETSRNEIDLMKQRQFIDRLQRLSNLKRKSDEILQKNYYTDILNTEKRQKIKDKGAYNKNNHLLPNSNYDNVKSIYDDCPLDVSSPYKPTSPNKINDKSKEQDMSDSPLELKAECDDMDIIVTDPAVCTTPRSFDGSREGKKELSLPLDYHSPQDNCTSLNSLFMDLKNLVNGKVGNMLRTNAEEPRPIVEHRLVTIPQKEDGKKKYPQRSCRLCWKIGKRRDTRFMCSACALSLVVNVNVSCDNQQLPVPYKYIYSRKGHKQLVHMNFVYTKHSTTHGKTSWRCVQYFSLNRCPATVETIDSMIYAVNHQHNHEHCLEKLARNSIYEMNASPK